MSVNSRPNLHQPFGQVFQKFLKSSFQPAEFFGVTIFTLSYTNLHFQFKLCSGPILYALLRLSFSIISVIYVLSYYTYVKFFFEKYSDAETFAVILTFLNSFIADNICLLLMFWNRQRITHCHMNLIQFVLQYSTTLNNNTFERRIYSVQRCLHNLKILLYVYFVCYPASLLYLLIQTPDVLEPTASLTEKLTVAGSKVSMVIFWVTAAFIPYFRRLWFIGLLHLLKNATLLISHSAYWTDPRKILGIFKKFEEIIADFNQGLGSLIAVDLLSLQLHTITLLFFASTLLIGGGNNLSYSAVWGSFMSLLQIFLMCDAAGGISHVLSNIQTCLKQAYKNCPLSGQAIQLEIQFNKIIIDPPQLQLGALVSFDPTTFKNVSFKSPIQNLTYSKFLEKQLKICY